MHKVVMNVLQGIVVTQTVWDGLTIYIFQLLISYGVYCQKIMKIGWQ